MLAFLYAMTGSTSKSSTFGNSKSFWSDTIEPKINDPTKQKNILEFTVPFLFPGEVSSFVAGFGFSKQELATLMEVRVRYFYN